MSAVKFNFRGPPENDPYRKRPHYARMYEFYIRIGHDPVDADAKALADTKANRFRHAFPVIPTQPSLFPGKHGGGA